jgi:SnoaL-like domain
MELWELVARERIRDCLARYNWSGDSLRLDELAESFCEDGELQLRGEEPVRGRAAIVAFIGGVATPGAERQATVASYFTVVT